MTNEEALCVEVIRLRERVQFLENERREMHAEMKTLRKSNKVLVRKLRKVEESKPIVDRLLGAIGLERVEAANSSAASAPAPTYEEELVEVQRHFHWAREHHGESVHFQMETGDGRVVPVRLERS